MSRESHSLASPLPPSIVSTAPIRLLALCTFLVTACGTGRETPKAPPNVLLVSIDTLRADHLSCYGYERLTTPRIDALAQEGVLFERTFATTSWTLPSHISMLTGLTISAHGICDDRLWTRTDEDGEAEPVTLAGTFLPERLAEAGYRTGGFYTWKYLEPRFGFGPGFEVYERLGHTFYSYPPVAKRFEELRAAADTAGLKALLAEYPELFDASRQSSPETIDRALEWIDEVRESPFFCFVHLFDAHDPYTPPPPFDTHFDPDYEGAITGKRVAAADSPVRGDMDPRDLEHVIALYDGGIAWVDSEVGRLVDQLKERALLENTIVVITSDHGEEFFEHGNKTHRHSLHVESVHVPLIMRWPAGIAQGLSVPSATGIIDIAPTLYGLLGLSAPEGIVGSDLSRVVRGEAENSERTYLTELLLFDYGAVPHRRVGLLRGSEHTLLRAVGSEPWEATRYDLEVDPRESGPGEAVEVLLEEQREVQRLARADSVQRPAGDAGPLTPTELAELAATGYVGIEGERRGAHATGRLCLDGCCWPDKE
jgi:arylsulfatase A-like enzyme